MRNHFNRQLLHLQKGLIEMLQIGAELIETLDRAFLFQDETAKGEIEVLCGEIEEMEQELSQLCARLLLRQAPVAKDLSLIFLVQQTIRDLKRIAEQSLEISFLLPALSKNNMAEVEGMEKLIEKASAMVLGSVEACLREDRELAESILRQDDLVDALLLEVKQSLIHLLQSRADQGEYALDLLLSAKYLERIADHAAHMAAALLERDGS